VRTERIAAVTPHWLLIFGYPALFEANAYFRQAYEQTIEDNLRRCDVVPLGS